MLVAFLELPIFPQESVVSSLVQLVDDTNTCCGQGLFGDSASTAEGELLSLGRGIEAGGVGTGGGKGLRGGG